MKKEFVVYCDLIKNIFFFIGFYGKVLGEKYEIILIMML